MYRLSTDLTAINQWNAFKCQNKVNLEHCCWIRAVFKNSSVTSLHRTTLHTLRSSESISVVTMQTLWLFSESGFLLTLAVFLNKRVSTTEGNWALKLCRPGQVRIKSLALEIMIPDVCPNVFDTVYSSFLHFNYGSHSCGTQGENELTRSGHVGDCAFLCVLQASV